MNIYALVASDRDNQRDDVIRCFYRKVEATEFLDSLIAWKHSKKPNEPRKDWLARAPIQLWHNIDDMRVCAFTVHGIAE